MTTPASPRTTPLSWPWLLALLLAACSPTENRHHLHEITPVRGLLLSPLDQEHPGIATSHGLYLLYPDGVVEPWSEEPRAFLNLTPHPTHTETLWAGVATPQGGTLWRSRDGGRQWQQVNGGTGKQEDFTLLALSPANNRVLYAQRAGGLQVSHDEGQTWETIGATPAGLRQLAVHPNNEIILFAATDQGLRMSLDGGLNWRFIEPALHPASLVQIGTDGKLYAFVHHHGLLVREMDAATGWTRLDNRFGEDAPVLLAQDRRQHQRMMAVTRDHGLLETRDGGYTWRPLAPPPRASDQHKD